MKTLVITVPLVCLREWTADCSRWIVKWNERERNWDQTPGFSMNSHSALGLGDRSDEFDKVGDVVGVCSLWREIVPGWNPNAITYHPDNAGQLVSEPQLLHYKNRENNSYLLADFYYFISRINKTKHLAPVLVLTNAPETLIP